MRIKKATDNLGSKRVSLKGLKFWAGIQHVSIGLTEEAAFGTRGNSEE
jgi:hypothetical protein